MSRNCEANRRTDSGLASFNKNKKETLMFKPESKVIIEKQEKRSKHSKHRSRINNPKGRAKRKSEKRKIQVIHRSIQQI